MKKVIALLLAVLMMLSLSACAQKAGQQNIESKAPEEVAQTESEAPAEEAGTDRLAERAHEDIRAQIEAGEQRQDAVSAGTDNTCGVRFIDH